MIQYNSSIDMIKNKFLEFWNGLTLQKKVLFGIAFVIFLYAFFVVFLQQLFRVTIQASLWVILRGTGYTVFHYSDNVFGVLVCAGLFISIITKRMNRITDFFRAFRGLFGGPDSLLTPSEALEAMSECGIESERAKEAILKRLKNYDPAVSTF